ncbi:MAG TPA: methylenetetrahydrofolate--tRNA-(uracil(54)-C(5))-methyltransferase (FADH(2)-oxidizing) TrmFO [Candidatus Ornithoclostridium faecavium]|nr:methylenetetrahydrofolate--tRNA-(uracil(54)-C(5))-methyltransferase (FADH(2)-oxidizing) TrmFO [Candidatus Ornithoclostridium faecavium]
MRIDVVGGGLAGSEAAYQLLKRGVEVVMYELRGAGNTPCHKTDNLAELVCSNSLKSEAEDTASGLLKAELDLLDCMLLRCARECRVPAGGALAVDREKFSEKVEETLSSFENFRLVRKEVTSLDFEYPTVIASGPLTSDALANAIADRLGADYLGFYDAVAPIVDAESVDMESAFFATRYDKGDPTDYLNCPLNKEEYEAFVKELVNAKVATLHEFDKREIFEACMPVEVMAKRGDDTLRYGPMRPVGIRDKEGKRPYAVVQLRKENAHGTAYNLVGFQTNLTFGEQKRVFGMIPALKNAEFLRYGVMHRNTFLCAPKLLTAGFLLKEDGKTAFAGQMTGVEGYVESIASGLIAALNIYAEATGEEEIVFPATTICGQLQRHVSTDNENYQPMNANFGILPPAGEKIRDKKMRKVAYFNRGIQDMKRFLEDRKI